MVLDTGFKKGIDLPTWEWLNISPAGSSGSGTSSIYDGNRFIYWVIGISTTTAVGTTTLWRYDTWNDGWQFLSNVTSGANGMDIEFDTTRNVLHIMHGGALTSWQVFNLNTSAVTIAGVSCPAWTLTTMTVVLPVASNIGASFTMPDDGSVPAVIDSLVDTGSTTTTVNSTTPRFGPGMVGLAVRYTSGAANNQSRLITAFVSPTQVTTNAFGAAAAAGDTFVVELPQAQAAAGAAGTLTLPANWSAAVNMYAFSDVLIVSGAGAGQRRRIASNTASVLTLAATVTGNPRTGNFTVTPDATSVFRIVPSSDFLYYQPGNGSTALYRLDVVANPASTWTSLTASPAGVFGGGNTMFPQSYAPFQILAFRGTATATYYAYNIGLGTWSTPNVFAGGEGFNTGASVCMMSGERKIFVAKEVATRTYMLDLTTGLYEPGPVMPYANPGLFDGKRAKFIKTADGAKFLYILRAGGQEFFRVACEWL